jgi:hypothetical protein
MEVPMKERLLPAALIAVGFAVGGWFVGDAIRYTKQFSKVVEVRGLDERIVKSDKASWQVGLVAAGASPSAAGDGWSAAAKAVRGYLLSAGFPEGEIRVGGASTNDTWGAGGPRTPAESRYTARGTVVVETANVDAVEKAVQGLSELARRGVLVENSLVRYFFTDLNAVKPEMLKNAAASARQAAEAFAKDANIHLGGLKSATQGLFTISAPLVEYDDSSIMKKVRVVTRAEYFLEK